MITFLILLLLFIAGIAIKDVFFNKSHAIQHNYPVVGHLRYMFEKIGPEIRQYFVANNREERPFSRRQREWIYASSKKQNNFQGFGTDTDFNNQGHVFIKNTLFPFHGNTPFSAAYLPCAKIIGPHRKRPFHPQSVVNISAMSYGALSPKAVDSLNRGALFAGCYHNTGEGGLSPWHKNGGDVVFQIGTGYFGVRNEDGTFNLDKLIKLVKDNPFIKAIEIKMSQGAKPGHGGILPGVKVNSVIASVRGVEIGKDVVSPPYHSAFNGTQGLIDFIEEISEATGLPVGIKAAVGNLHGWIELAGYMRLQGKGPDFITIDGGEGGTGAAPISFTDSVSLPFNQAFTSVYQIFLESNLTEKIVFIASAKLGFAPDAIKAFAMGADMINVAREALMSIGCIQAQMCHTDKCPTGIATQNIWRQEGVDVTLKSIRCANYITALRKEILEISRACGRPHPGNFQMADVALQTGDVNDLKTLEEIFKYKKDRVSAAWIEKKK
jgi:glutamate synthase domain-containing protein 2